MHLKQQNYLLIDKLWITENFPQEASSGSLSIHPVLGNKKKWLQRKVQVKFCILICCSAHALWAKDYHYVDCYAFQSLTDLTKSEKYASFATAILIL